MEGKSRKGRSARKQASGAGPDLSLLRAEGKEEEGPMDPGPV